MAKGMQCHSYLMDLNSFLWVDVLRLHEISGFVRPNRDRCTQQQIKVSKVHNGLENRMHSPTDEYNMMVM